MIMNREYIEKAAGEYSHSSLGFRNDYYVMGKHKAFADGAEWRINSIWHDASEPAEQIRTILILNKLGGIQINYTGKFSDWSEYVKLRNIEKWCYKEDLLPNTED